MASNLEEEAMSQEMQAASKRWNWQGKSPSCLLQKESSPADPFGFLTSRDGGEHISAIFSC